MQCGADIWKKRHAQHVRIWACSAFCWNKLCHVRVTVPAAFRGARGAGEQPRFLWNSARIWAARIGVKARRPSMRPWSEATPALTEHVSLRHRARACTRSAMQTETHACVAVCPQACVRAYVCACTHHVCACSSHAGVRAFVCVRARVCVMRSCVCMQHTRVCVHSCSRVQSRPHCPP